MCAGISDANHCKVCAVSGREEHALLFLLVSGAPTGQGGVGATPPVCKRDCVIIGCILCVTLTVLVRGVVKTGRAI